MTGKSRNYHLVIISRKNEVNTAPAKFNILGIFSNFKIKLNL